MYKKEWWVAFFPIQLFWLSGCRHRHGNASTHFHVETPSIQNAAILELLTSLITFRHFYNNEWEDALKSFTPRLFRSLGLMNEESSIRVFPFHLSWTFFKAKKYSLLCLKSHAKEDVSQTLAAKSCELFCNIMLQSELEGEVTRFITHVQTCLATSQMCEYQPLIGKFYTWIINIRPPSCVRCTLLRKERLSSKGYNKLTFIVEILLYLK